MNQPPAVASRLPVAASARSVLTKDTVGPTGETERVYQLVPPGNRR